MRVSVVIPFLNEEEVIPELYGRLSEVARKMAPLELEVIFVDDGSTDGSAIAIRNLPSGGPPIRLVRLSRNFGSYAALAAGMTYATGDAVTNISADLQDPPELIFRLIDKWREGYEIVFATRETRDDPWMSTVLAKIYYRLMRKYAIPTMPMGGCDICLVDRKVIESLGSLQEKNSNLFCMLMWAGFSQHFVPYHREQRRSGRSKWTFGKKLKLFVDSFVAFSFFPIRLISGLGAVVSILGLIYAGYVVVRQLMFGFPIAGWASLMVVVLLCSGLQLLMLGIVSEYLWRALDASRNRPSYIVREVEEFPTTSSAIHLGMPMEAANLAT